MGDELDPAVERRARALGLAIQANPQMYRSISNDYLPPSRAAILATAEEFDVFLRGIPTADFERRVRASVVDAIVAQEAGIDSKLVSAIADAVAATFSGIAPSGE